MNITLDAETKAGVKEVVIPYFLNKDLLPAGVLGNIYEALVAEGSLGEVLHEKENSKDDFISYVEKFTLPSVFANVEENRIDGIAWLSDIAITDTHTKASGSYCFLKQAWDTKRSLHYGKICVAQWFFPEQFGISYPPLDSLWGLTPKSNRLARRFATRLGMKYVANLPGFTCHHGKRVDALVCNIEREEFRAKWGQ